eukprot:gene3066-2048_t
MNLVGLLFANLFGLVYYGGFVCTLYFIASFVMRRTLNCLPFMFCYNDFDFGCIYTWGGDTCNLLVDGFKLLVGVFGFSYFDDVECLLLVGLNVFWMLCRGFFACMVTDLLILLLVAYCYKFWECSYCANRGILNAVLMEYTILMQLCCCVQAYLVRRFTCSVVMQLLDVSHVTICWCGVVDFENLRERGLCDWCMQGIVVTVTDFLCVVLFVFWFACDFVGCITHVVYTLFTMCGCVNCELHHLWTRVLCVLWSRFGAVATRFITFKFVFMLGDIAVKVRFGGVLVVSFSDSGDVGFNVASLAVCCSYLDGFYVAVALNVVFYVLQAIWFAAVMQLWVFYCIVQVFSLCMVNRA